VHTLWQVGSIAKGNIDFPIIQEVFVSMRGLLQIHSPALVITVDDIASSVHEALTLAISHSNTILVQLPHAVVPHALWMAEVRTSALQCEISFSLACLQFLRTCKTVSLINRLSLKGVK
jgi:hypothetical protein